MRCFVAAWPDEATRAALATLIAQLRPVVLQARPMQPRNLHLTLAFIGALDAGAAAVAAQALHGSPIEAPGWTIDRLGWFARARVAWAGGPESAALAAAAARTRARLDELGIDYDRKPFVPHVSLFRDVRHFEQAGALAVSVAWQSLDVALYVASRDEYGPVYRRVRPAEQRG